MKEPSWQGPCVAFFLREELEPEAEKVLKRLLSAWKETDDVLSLDFLNCIIVTVTPSLQKDPESTFYQSPSFLEFLSTNSLVM